MKNLLKASAITGSAFLINLVFNTIRAKIVAVFLGPDGVAVLAQLGGFTNLVITICSLGLATAIVRYVAEYKAEGRQQDLKTLIATVLIVITSVSTLVTILMLLFIPLVSQIIFGKEIFLALIALSILNIPISTITNLAVGLLQGLKEIKLDAIFSVFATVFTGLLMILLLLPFGLNGAIVGMLVANYITSAIFFIFVFRSLNFHLNSNIGYLQLAGIRNYFKLGSLRPLTGIAVASLIGGGITNFAEILIRSNLIKVFGLVVAGSIQPALTFSAQYTGLLGGAISTYALPRLSELSNTDRPLFQKEYNDFVRLMLLVVTPFAILIAIGAWVLVPLLYSQRFDAAIPLVPIQSVADVIEFTFIGLAGAFLPMGRGKILLGLGIMIPTVYYFAYLSLVGSYGLIAVPLASAASWLIASGVSYIILRRSLKLEIRRKNFWLMGNSIISTVLVAISINTLPLVAGTIVSLIILASWLLINVSGEERRMIAGLIKKRFGES